MLTLLLTTLPAASAQSDQRCFPETGFCISGRIREFWEQNGGLPVFGFPITPQQEEMVEGKAVQVQWFERNRIELHPENRRPYDVLLGRLGADRLAQQGRDFFTFPTSQPQRGCRYFPETQHNVCGDILTMWRSNGLEFDGRRGKSEAESLALFGLPLSDLMTEEIDGRVLQVQWFERARFELHPENAPPYNVLLGLLGNEVRAHMSTPPAPPPSLPPPTFNNCQAEPNPGAAPNYPVRIVGIDKRAETVTLRNVSPDPVDLTGWRMCSILGNQFHPIGGILQPGEERLFPGPEGNIWNNSERDDGALYDAEGRLVSYYEDR
ncbi:lamin tail domain-containing protein [Chloroflexus sp.]|uniref:lamin tail domain-containing protein n=1 Tax=Chloroflexus sp. TaxID=1904827 RepID=UPI002ADE0458|nr:lamin tail domain-containing protein [Chloroflexus sp.]